MNLSRILSNGCRLINQFHIVSTASNVKKLGKLAFSSFCNFQKPLESRNLTLTSISPLISTSRGMKVKGQLRLRCKNCYFARKDGIMYVFCSSYPRHNQRGLTKKPKYTWILTHAFQSKIRPY